MLSLIKSRVQYLAQHGIDIHCGVEVTEELIKEKNPDVLVVATGSRPAVPEIPGIHADAVMTGDEALKAKEITGKHVVVLGAGLIGCEVAGLSGRSRKPYYYCGCGFGGCFFP